MHTRPSGAPRDRPCRTPATVPLFHDYASHYFFTTAPTCWREEVPGQLSHDMFRETTAPPGGRGARMHWQPPPRVTSPPESDPAVIRGHSYEFPAGAGVTAGREWRYIRWNPYSTSARPTSAAADLLPTLPCIIARTSAFPDTPRIPATVSVDGRDGQERERAGTCTVTMEREGYQGWSGSGIHVPRTDCHLRTVLVHTRLQR